MLSQKAEGFGGQRGKGEGRAYDVFINSSPSKKLTGGEGNQTELPSHADAIIVFIFAKIMKGLEHKLA